MSQCTGTRRRHRPAPQAGAPALAHAGTPWHAAAPRVAAAGAGVAPPGRASGRCARGPLAGAVFAAVALVAFVPGFTAAVPLAAQDVTVVEYEPRSTLVVPENRVTRARFPFVDIHGHQRGRGMSAEAVDRLVAEMDELNMAVMVNLSGGSGVSLVEGLEILAGRHPSRFVFFANINFFGVGEPGWGEEAAAQLERDVRNGAAGLKIFKGLGMSDRDTDGNRIPVDDPRLAPLWDKAGELGIPVLIHSADPAEFWQPHDRFNERWLELRLRPRRIRPPDRFPSFEQIIGEQHNLFRNHPNTNFISAHLGWLGHDLGRLGQLLDEIPNMYVGLGAVIYELGRQPRFARQWLTRVPGPRADGEGLLQPGGVPHLLPRLRNGRRVLRLLPELPRLLADVRPRPARRGPAEDLLRERAEARAGDRPEPVSGVARRRDATHFHTVAG